MSRYEQWQHIPKIVAAKYVKSRPQHYHLLEDIEQGLAERLWIMLKAHKVDFTLSEAQIYTFIFNGLMMWAPKMANFRGERNSKKACDIMQYYSREETPSEIPEGTVTPDYDTKIDIKGLLSDLRQTELDALAHTYVSAPSGMGLQERKRIYRERDRAIGYLREKVSRG